MVRGGKKFNLKTRLMIFGNVAYAYVLQLRTGGRTDGRTRGRDILACAEGREEGHSLTAGQKRRMTALDAYERECKK